MRHKQVLQSKNSKRFCHCGGQYDEICKYFTEGKQETMIIMKFKSICNFTI